MNECICLKGVTFDRKYFHSATLVRPGEEAGERYSGNLTLSVNFIVPNIAGNQGVLKTMLLKESAPIDTIDLYLILLGRLMVELPDRGCLIEELLTADEKALSKGATFTGTDSPDTPSVLGATEEDAK